MESTYAWLAKKAERDAVNVLTCLVVHFGMFCFCRYTTGTPIFRKTGTIIFRKAGTQRIPTKQPPWPLKRCIAEKYQSHLPKYQNHQAQTFMIRSGGRFCSFSGSLPVLPNLWGLLWMHGLSRSASRSMPPGCGNGERGAEEDGKCFIALHSPKMFPPTHTQFALSCLNSD